MVVKNGLDYRLAWAARAVPDRQKVAMVRALLKRPVVLVFDQAAAVLDPTTQLVVENVLRAQRQDGGVGAVAPGVRRPLRYRAGDGARPARGARRSPS